MTFLNSWDFSASICSILSLEKISFVPCVGGPINIDLFFQTWVIVSWIFSFACLICKYSCSYKVLLRGPLIWTYQNHVSLQGRKSLEKMKNFPAPCWCKYWPVPKFPHNYLRTRDIAHVQRGSDLSCKQRSTRTRKSEKLTFNPALTDFMVPCSPRY